MSRTLTIANPEWHEGFPKRGLKPGMVFELANGRLELVGHVNEWGSLDDCNDAFGEPDGRKVVVRWAQVLVFPGRGG